MEPISKYGITLRLITVNDAEFIVNLWTNPLVKSFISAFSPTIHSQIKWIQDYKLKEQLGLDYYFIVEDENHNQYGTIRLNYFEEDSFVLGTWVFMPNSPFGMAVKAHIIGLETGFKLSKSNYCKISVVKENLNVLRYLENFNPIKINEDNQYYYFLLPKNNFYSFKNKFSFFQEKTCCDL